MILYSIAVGVKAIGNAFAFGKAIKGWEELMAMVHGLLGGKEVGKAVESRK